jgi:TetR/AcrR family transcriptional repressor of lmrAB and yxaGH operons
MPRLKLARAEIIARLIDAFRSHGFDGTSIAQISADTGLGRASLYHHFPDGKEQMLLTAVHHEHKRLEGSIIDLLRGDDPPRERLAAWAGALAAEHGDGRVSLLAALTCSGALPSAREVLQRGVTAQRTALVAVLVEDGIPPAIAEGRARAAGERLQGALLMAQLDGEAGSLLSFIGRLPADLLRSL